MRSIVKKIEVLGSSIPEFCTSHWLLRIPLALIFIQQGLMKLPVDAGEAESYGLSVLVWWFVALGELGGGLGLLVGGVLNNRVTNWLGDMVTRFSGFTIGCITTGVIWIGEPESFLDVLLYDNLHVLMWVGGLFFALRGNRA
jgi:putative oxidoreductase